MTVPNSAYDLAAAALAKLADRGETLATAESLTGGLIGATLTAVPGSSAVYRGGVISYATDLKTELAGVAPTTLDAVGPVAEQTAAEMARGAANRCVADWALAVTGVAGPDAQDGHPVGQVYLALAGPDGRTVVAEQWLSGDRMAVRAATVRAALGLLIDQLEEGSEVRPRS